MSQVESMQMAVVNYAPEADSVELQEIPVPEIGPDEVLLEVAAVGVCGSDLHQWTADHSWPVNYPVVLGHEFAGTISKTGELVRNWSIGDRVVSETAAIIDPDNPLSREGRYNLDPTRKGGCRRAVCIMCLTVCLWKKRLSRNPAAWPLTQSS
jgi:alcohol dehydrogenase/L-iditol 2-dehydrogenase